MDELAQSNGIMKEAEVEQKQNETTEVVQWERFLPRMVLRVLLVEADRSTRRIITALLKKCSCKVTAVSDGLKAWETLKRKSHELDLILTEVDLPAISGFALLTLIMEHDICKNIPVIMMSTHDSVSVVYKCMLRGAADFLIKPVRKNELRNLWQHVWRRQSITTLPQNPTFPQKKPKIPSNDKAASNQSSGSMASSKNNECSEAQSTCTSPILEAERAYMQNMQDVSQLKSCSKLSNIDSSKHGEFSKFEGESADHNNETRETIVSEVGNKTFILTDLRLKQDHDFAETENKDRISRAEFDRENPDVITCGSSDEQAKSSKEAINLIATFENLPKQNEEKCSFTSGNTTEFDFDTQLELSLRRDFPGSSCKQPSEATEESQGLNHSNTSAFSWYGSKLLQPLFPIPSIASAKVNGANWENMTSMVVRHCGQDGSKLSTSQCGLLPVAGVISDLDSNGHCNVFTPVFYAQSGIHPMWIPKPVCQKESSPFPASTTSQSNPESHYSDEHNDRSNDTATYASLSQNTKDKSNSDHARHDSPAACHSGGNSMCHDAANGIHSDAYGSKGSGNDAKAPSTMVSNNYPESFSDSGGRHNCDEFRLTGSDRAIQRAAALTKFRLKRKDRCYEKKVRYHGRKRLAEQRPRVKGQFVSQVHNDHPVADAGGDS